jgi:hypothetical protein
MTWDQKFLDGLILVLGALPSWAVPFMFVSYLIYRGFRSRNESHKLDTLSETIPAALTQINGNIRELIGRLDTLLDLMVRTRARRQ